MENSFVSSWFTFRTTLILTYLLSYSVWIWGWICFFCSIESTGAEQRAKVCISGKKQKSWRAWSWTGTYLTEVELWVSANPGFCRPSLSVFQAVFLSLAGIHWISHTTFKGIIPLWDRYIPSFRWEQGQSWWVLSPPLGWRLSCPMQNLRFLPQHFDLFCQEAWVKRDLVNVILREF